MLFFQTLIILRLADIPLDENTNSAPSCKIGDVCPDRAWVFAFGWSFCLLALAIFFISAIIELTKGIRKQVAYPNKILSNHLSLHPPLHLPLLPAFVLRRARSVWSGEPRPGALFTAYAVFLGRVPVV